MFNYNLKKHIRLHRKTVKILLPPLLAFSPTLHAIDQSIDDLSGLNQSEFKAFSEDLGAALSYKAVSPAEPLGTLGFDIGVEATATNLGEPELFERVSTDSSPDYLVLTKLHAHKGLPFGIDIGASYAAAPSSNIKVFGGEIRYALIKGNVAIPALAVRGTYTRLTGVDVLDLDTKGLELTVSKGLLPMTPYAGVGRIWTSSDPKGTDLSSVSVGQNKVFAGLSVNFTLLNTSFEVDNTGGVTSYSLKLGLRF